MRKGLTYSEAGKLGALRSAKTHKKQKQERIEKYNLDPTRCKFCNHSMSYEKRKNKFCNHSCSASFNNLGIIRNNTTGEWKRKECLYCQKITTNSKFCSHQCNKKYGWEKRKREIEETEIIPERRVGIRYLKEIRGDKCEICGIMEWRNKKLVMIMDHIDGNANNNTILNLRLICPNCDSQTSTYKGRNKGNGRFSRRQRYAAGKSY